MEFSVNIEPDEEGYMGRECPACERYFKITPGTGIPGFTDCYCPYCRHFGPQDEFLTSQQIDYVQSVALNKFSEDLLREMKKMERKPKKNQFVSIGIKVEGRPTPITYYSEKELEERVTCSWCSLDYAIYGAFGYCPDCASHNSHQILIANLGLVERMVELAENEEDQVRDKLIENALEDSISAFDGYARERCADLYEKISFQNIEGAREKLLNDHAIDISSGLTQEQWNFVLVKFQMRHLLAHKMGVVDEEYARKTNGDISQVGRKVSVSKEDVLVLINHIKILADNLAKNVERR